MRIERIYILCHRDDLNLAKICVASVRRWYPAIPISLIKDDAAGPFDTSEIETHWDVAVLDTADRVFGWGFGKLEPLFITPQQRCLILDADTALLGPVLDELEKLAEQFVVASENHDAVTIGRMYLSPDRLKAIDPDFTFPGYAFNTGHFVATTGVLTREDFSPFVTFDQPRKLIQPEVFKCADQGVLNYVLLKQRAAGAITLRRHPFARWCGTGRIKPIVKRLLGLDAPAPAVMHWAGQLSKRDGTFLLAPYGHVLRRYRRYYVSHTPGSADRA